MPARAPETAGDSRTYPAVAARHPASEADYRVDTWAVAGGSSKRTTSWLTGYRRLNHRYERSPRNRLAFPGLATAICCYKRYVRLTT